MPRLPCLLSLAFALAAPVRAQDQPLWRYVSDDSIASIQLSHPSGLIVSTVRSHVFLDFATGEVRWTLPKVGVTHGLQPLHGGRLSLLRTDDSLAILDNASGITRWTSRTLPLQRVTWTVVPAEPDSLLFVLGDSPQHQRRLVLVRFENGTVEWTRDNLVYQGAPLAEPVLRDTDSSIIIRFVRQPPMLLHARTGATLWLATPQLDELYQRPVAMIPLGGLVLLAAGQDLAAIGKDDGGLVWRRTDRKSGRLAQFELTRHGLLVRGEVLRGTRPCGDDTCSFKEGKASLDLLDPQTGRSVWARPLYDNLDPSTPFVVIGDTAYLVAKGWLRAVSLADGRMTAIAATPFRGGDQARWIESRPDGFLVWSDQNLLLIGRDGRLVYHRFYSTPRRVSTLEAILAVAADAAFNEQLSFLNPVLWERAGAAGDRPDDFYFFTNQPDSTGRTGFSVVRVDKREGRELGRVWVDQRRPEFQLAHEAGMLLLRRGRGEIVALKFP